MSSTSPAFGTIGRRQFLLIVSGFWLYVALSNILYAEAMSVAFSEATQESLFASWYARLLQHVLLYPIVLLCLRAALRVGWTPLWRALPLQLLLAVCVSALARPALYLAQVILRGLHALVFGGAIRPTGDYAEWLGRMFSDILLAGWLASFTSFMVAYGFGLAILTGFGMYRRLRDVEAQWNAARLDALKSQLSPHTLFNLLHTIRGQIGWDPAAAQKMVVQLADLLRRLLSAGERDFVELREELQFVTLYLQLQQQRFSDRLQVRLPDPATVPAARVPSLILQPLVENAVVHGLANHDGAVTVTLDARFDNGALSIDIENDMARGQTAAAPGVGLRNVRQRLEVQYGGRASLLCGPMGEGRWRAQVQIPQPA
jgi:hypothetical protein